jgi:8-oxo-dGTP pyrophosphatase MutT (NUDIX family)
MPIPQFDLRAAIGHAPLWLIGVTAVVIRDDEVLLIERADNGIWAPVTGIVDPGEEPADAAIAAVLNVHGETRFEWDGGS